MRESSVLDQNSMIVFVCEHGAAKSIIAAAFFNKVARDMGLTWRAIARATDPQPELSLKAVTGLNADGLSLTELTPKKLDSEDIAKARMVISFCQLPEEFLQNVSIEHWDDVPPVSDDYEKSRDAILAHLRQLVNIL